MPLFQELLFPDCLSPTPDKFPVELKGRIAIMNLEVFPVQRSGKQLCSDNPNAFLDRSSSTYAFKDPVLDGSIVRRRIQNDLWSRRWKFSFWGVVVISIRSLSDGASRRCKKILYGYDVSSVFPDDTLVVLNAVDFLLSMDKSPIFDKRWRWGG
jgi:hypothetical protein